MTKNEEGKKEEKSDFKSNEGEEFFCENATKFLWTEYAKRNAMLHHKKDYEKAANLYDDIISNISSKECCSLECEQYLIQFFPDEDPEDLIFECLYEPESPLDEDEFLEYEKFERMMGNRDFSSVTPSIYMRPVDYTHQDENDLSNNKNYKESFTDICFKFNKILLKKYLLFQKLSKPLINKYQCFEADFFSKFGIGEVEEELIKDIFKKISAKEEKEEKEKEKAKNAKKVESEAEKAEKAENEAIENEKKEAIKKEKEAKEIPYLLLKYLNHDKEKNDFEFPLRLLDERCSGINERLIHIIDVKKTNKKIKLTVDLDKPNFDLDDAIKHFRMIIQTHAYNLWEKGEITNVYDLNTKFGIKLTSNFEPEPFLLNGFRIDSLIKNLIGLYLWDYKHLHKKKVQEGYEKLELKIQEEFPEFKYDDYYTAYRDVKKSIENILNRFPSKMI